MCEGLWELQMIGEIQEQIPQVCFQSSLPLMLPSHPWRWDFPDSLLWAAMSTALAFGALGWGWKDILIFCILLPRGLFSSACQQPHSLPWPSCQVKLHLAIAPLCVLLGFCLKDHLQIWSQLNLYISLFPVREYYIHYRCSDWFWIFPALTLKFSLAFLLSFSSHGMVYLHVKNQVFQAHKGLKGPRAPTPHGTDGERLEPRLLTPSPVAFPDS